MDACSYWNFSHQFTLVCWKRKKTRQLNTADALSTLTLVTLNCYSSCILRGTRSTDSVSYRTGSWEAASAKVHFSVCGYVCLCSWRMVRVGPFIAFLCIFGTVITVIDKLLSYQSGSLRLLILDRGFSQIFEHLDDHYLLLLVSSSPSNSLLLVKFPPCFRFTPPIGFFLTTPILRSWTVYWWREANNSLLG